MDRDELEIRQRLRRDLREVCEAYVELDGWPNGLWQVVFLIKEAVSETVDEMEKARRERPR